HRPAVGIAVVLRTPIADPNRRIDHNRGRLHAIRECTGVDVRFERGTRLVQRVDRAVELSLPIVAAAHDGVHAAAPVHYSRPYCRRALSTTPSVERCTFMS